MMSNSLLKILFLLNCYRLKISGTKLQIGLGNGMLSYIQEMSTTCVLEFLVISGVHFASMTIPAKAQPK